VPSTGNGTLAERRAKKTKKPATPPSTKTIIPSKLRIPQFIPAAMAESDWP
jgi:hypothetical protein